MKRNSVLLIAEILVMGGIATALIAPLFSAEESDEVRQSYFIQGSLLWL